jgi:hypothetical protein
MFILTVLKQVIKSLNDSKLLSGLIMIILNVGSKYIEMGFSKTQEEALRNGLARELLIFSVAFMGTRDIILSLLITAAFITLSNYLLNEQSKFCLIPNHLRKIALQVDTNKDGFVSDEEERNAIEILKKAELQKTRNKQKTFMNYMVEHQV